MIKHVPYQPTTNELGGIFAQSPLLRKPPPKKKPKKA
jgi:hypothetical protein